MLEHADIVLAVIKSVLLFAKPVIKLKSKNYIYIRV